MEKYVAYYRVSTQKQERSGWGLAAQKEAIKVFIAVREAALEGEYTDARSGKRNDRPELHRAIARAKQAKARLLIPVLDRFSRRVSFIAQIMESGVGLTVAEMPNATDFQLHIHAALAQEEGRRTSERTKAALAQVKKGGKELGKNGRQLAIKNRERADRQAANMMPVIAQIGFEWSYSEIARRLNERGCKTIAGRCYCAQTVKNLVARFNRL